MYLLWLFMKLEQSQRNLTFALLNSKTQHLENAPFKIHMRDWRDDSKVKNVYYFSREP